MKINKKLIDTIEWGIAIVLLIVCIKSIFFSYGDFNQIKAHEAAERTLHYGPSEIVDTIDLDDIKIYLCRYKDWFSTSTVKKNFVKWNIGYSTTKEIKTDEKVTWTYNGLTIRKHEFLMKLYGYVNDEDISTITLEIVGDTGSEVLEYQLNENRMFVFCWKIQGEKYGFKYLKGINDAGKVVYEKAIHY